MRSWRRDSPNARFAASAAIVAVTLFFVVVLQLLLMSCVGVAHAQQLGPINAGPTANSATYISNGTIMGSPNRLDNGDFTESLYFTNPSLSGITLTFSGQGTDANTITVTTPATLVVPASTAVLYSFNTVCLTTFSRTAFILTVSIQNTPGTTVNISYTRDCTPPSLHVGESQSDSANIYNGTDFVWTKTLPDPSSLDERNFFISLASLLGGGSGFPINVSVVSSNLTVASPAATPNLFTTSLGTDRGRLVNVEYFCLVAGNIIITMTVNYGWPNSVSFQWRKTCLPRNLQPQPFWNVGLTATGTEIVVNGTAQSPFDSSSSPYAFTQQQQFLTLYFTLAPTTFNMSTVTCDNLVNNIPNQGANGLTTAPAGFNTFVPNATVVPFTFTSVCRQSGAQMITELVFQCATGIAGNQNQLSTLNVFYSWTCQMPNIRMGTADGTDNVISNSVASLNFYPPIYDPYGMNIGSFFTNSRSYLAYFVLSPAIAGVTVSPANYSLIDGELTINCTVVQTTQQTTLLYYFGFESPIRVPMTIQCGAAAPVNNESNPSSVSGAGVAAIVIVVLVFVACVAGCVYNQNVAGKRGWEIVPGFTQFEACKDKVMGPQRYTPQMDDYDQGGSTGGYGSTASGSRYQNNL